MFSLFDIYEYLAHSLHLLECCMKRLTVDIIVNTSTGVHNYVNCFFLHFIPKWLNGPFFNIITTVSQMAKISLKWLKWFSLKWLKWFSLKWLKWFSLKWLKWFSLKWLKWFSLKLLKWFSLKWLKWSTFRKFCINHVKIFHILSYE